MLRISLVLLTALSGLGFFSHPASAQRGSRYFSSPEYQRLGLEQAWSTHVQLDSRRAQANAIVLRVVGLNSYQRLQELLYRVFEVSYDGQSVLFGENDVDSLGRVIGRAEAQRLAEKQVILLEARGLKPTLTTHDIPPTVIYAQSTAGTLHAMDAETGKTMWAATVGDPRWPMLPPAANEDYVATVNGSSLYLLNRTTGEPIWDRPLGMNPTSALAMSSSFVFIPGANGQIEGYRLPTAEDDHRISEPWVFHSSTQVTAAPAIGSTTISWATERGQMFVADLEGPTVLYQFQAGGPIMGQARFLPPDRWVVASTDGYVSALDERTGASKWDFSAGADIDQAPIAQPDATYAVTRQNQLFCVSSEDGLEKWVAPGIQQLLACGKQRLYARGVGGTIVALDKQTGEKLASLSAADYQIGYSNNLTDRVYLMSSSGTLLCLREQTAPLPTLHVPLPQPPERPGTRAREQTSADEPAAAAPPRTDAANDDLLGDDLFGLDDPAADEEPAADAEPAADILDPSDDPAADEAAEEPADEPAADDEEPGAEEQGTEEQGAEDPGTEEADDPFDFG